MFAPKSKFFAYFLIASTVLLSFYPLASVQAKTLNFGTVSDTVSVPGTLLNSKLAGTGNRCLYVDASGNVSAKGVDCGTATGGDEMGAHSATQNIRLNAYWLSGDGGNEGVFVNSDGNVGIGTNSITAGTRLLNSGNFVTTGTVSFTGVTFAGGGNRMITVDNSGVLGAAAIPVDTNTDIYWNGGTGGGFVASTARSSLQLGALATLGSVSNAYITDMAWSKLTGFPSACSAGQYVTAVGSTLTCSTPAGGVSGSGTANYVSKWSSGSALTNSKIYDNGTSVGVNTASPSGANLQINAASTLEALRLVSAASYSPLNIRNSGNTADIFRVDQTGSLAVGSVPWARLTSYPAACSAGQYVTAVGGTLTCATPTDTNTDIYWNGGTGGGFVASTARSSLQLGALATLGSVSNAYITDMAWSKLTGFPSACSAGQYVTAVGSTLTCSTPAGGVSGSGTANYVSKWSSGSALGNSIIYDNGTYVGIGTSLPGTYKLNVNGNTNITGNLVISGTVDGTDISAKATNWDAAYTHSSDVTGAVHGATSANTVNMIVRRDSNGDFTARRVTADLIGAASSAAVATSLSNNGTNCSAGQYPLGVDERGNAETCTSIPSMPAVGASGTTIRSNGTSWLSNSNLYNNGTNVGIGTASPGAKLDVNGSFRSNSSVTFSTFSGGGTRALTVDNSGVLGAAAIPATLPSGTTSQTLRNNGLGGWSASSFLWNSGSTVGINYAQNACDSSIKLAVNGIIETTGIKVDSALPIGGVCATSGNIGFRAGIMEFTSSGGTGFTFDNLVSVTGRVNATTGFAYNGTVGVSQSYSANTILTAPSVWGGIITAATAVTGLTKTVSVRYNSTSNCNLVFTSGILTSTTCP